LRRSRVQLDAQVANAGLLKNFPKGYSLGDEHAPHMSVIGGYFHTANLGEIFATANKVLANEKVTSWNLKAFKYYYIPLKKIGLGGILVEPTADLIRLQNELFDAIGRFMGPGSSGTAAAFKTTPDSTEINQATIDAVANYFAAHRGEHTAHMSRSASAQSITWTPCSLCSFPHLRFQRREGLRTSSATSELRPNCSTPST
jgi:hypothetical protein